MPTETKNSTAKASRKGSDSVRRLLGEPRLAERHAGEEGAERERDAEQRRRDVSHAERDGEHGEAEQLAAAGMGDMMQDRRDELLADEQHDGDEDGELAEHDGDLDEHLGEIGCHVDAAKEPREPGQQHEHDDHGEVLHHQPTDGDPPALGLDQASLLQEAKQNHRARDRERHAEDEAAAQGPIEPPADGDAERRGDERLRERARNGDGAHREEVLEREMEPDAEHQEDDAHLGELVGDVLVGDVARGEGTDEDARDQIADERGKLEAVARATPGRRRAQERWQASRREEAHAALSELSARTSFGLVQPDNDWRRPTTLWRKEALAIGRPGRPMRSGRGWS